MITISKKIVSIFFVLSLLLALVLPLTASADTPSPTFSDTYDYFTDKYEALTDTYHVFKTAEYYQFYNYILGGTDLKALYGETANATVQPASGQYVFLLGGIWSSATQAAIGYVNEVAKEYGITAIYNFDPKLDGGSLDISTDPVYATKYTAILTKLGVTSLSFPSVIVYEKDSVTTGHIVSSFSWSDTSFSSQQAVDAFKSSLRTNAFSPAAANGKIVNIDVSDSDYFRSVVNARYFSFALNKDNSDGTTFKQTLKPLSESKHNVFEVVSLSELRGILASDGHYAVLLGGLWCHNTWAVLHRIEEYAEKFHLDKVYFYDTVLDSAGSSTSSADQLQTRSSTYKPSGTAIPSPIAHLYVDLINDYLPNIYSLNQGEYDANTAAYAAAGLDAPASLSGKFISYQKESEEVTGRRAQLPNFFVYNKNHKAADGSAAPVIGQVELMTELWFTDSSSPTYNQDTTNQNGGYPNGSTTDFPIADYYTKGYNRAFTVKITSGTSSSGTTYSNESPYSYTYTYWAPGLNQVLGAFISHQLGARIGDAEALNASDYTATSYNALRTSLQSAKELKASIDAAVAEKSADALTPEGSAIVNTYAALEQSLAGLIVAKTTSGISQATNSSSSSRNPQTGEATESQAVVFIVAAITLSAGAILYTLRENTIKNNFT